MRSDLASILDGSMQSGTARSGDITRDLLLLIFFSLVLIATGIGLRDPWPADEPRFALIAKDMVTTGEWLIPRVAGDLYAEKPPLFLWLIAAALRITGEMRVAFLLPSLLAALGTVCLVYDITRRLWDRRTGLLAGLLLLTTIQFVWQARQAQIDAVLCFWTTLSLYGLLRHLILGPQWRWYAVGWFAAGLGVITKGVGFLPLLILLPFVVVHRRGWSDVAFGSRVRWLVGPLAFVAAVSIWLVPMLLAAQQDPALAAYRDEILFEQTITRYANAWHHHEPFYYFLVYVIPMLWLPLTALLPWLVPSWLNALRARDVRIALLLCWVVLVVFFFSVSAGKRGVYVLPAVPALVMASAPVLASLLQQRVVQRMLFAIAVSTAALCALASGYALLTPDLRLELEARYGINVVGPLLCMAGALAAICTLTRVRRGAMAYGASVACVLLVVSFWINPAMNDLRSGERLIRDVQAVANPERELGLSMFKEQYLLQLPRPVVHFGHGRWQEGYQEVADAARWVSSAPGRELLITEFDLKFCFDPSQAVPIGRAHRETWLLVRGGANAKCMADGNLQAARRYVPGVVDTGLNPSRVRGNPF